MYVGNYPLTFDAEDLLNIFQDYEGIKLVTFVKKEMKCYSFFHCVSERQLIEIIKNLHNIDVCGRNLIVRAADENYHKAIVKRIMKDDDVELHPRNTCDQSNSTSLNGSNKFSALEKARDFRNSVSRPAGFTENKKEHKINQNDYKVCNSCMPNAYNSSKKISKQNQDTSDDYGSYNYSSFTPVPNFSPQQNSPSTKMSSDSSNGKGTSTYNPKVNKHYEEKPVPAINAAETFSKLLKSKTDSPVPYKTIGERFDSFNTNNKEYKLSTNHHASNFREKYQPCNKETGECSEFFVQDMSFVSVVNFPLHLPVKELYELFSDFNPLKVLMVCNKPKADKTPTEAIICFENDKDATDAILTLDNTVFRGRVLLVTDAVDQSLVEELLSF